jgi:putative radical SAM enzyme (TIGR03279 family)
MALKIKEITENSIAEEAGMLAGMMILSINGEIVRDFIDLQYLTSEELLEIEIQDGWKRKKFFVQNDFASPLGIVPGEHRCRTCANSCIFCFVDQMRPNSRKTLHFKDDDPTFSFFFGNFITLTNLAEGDFEQIISQSRSPLYISVHTTNPKLHKRMLRYKHDFNIRERLQILNDAGIDLHTQIVLIPGWNDGEELNESLKFLTSLESVMTIGIVPVGLTQYRDGLTELRITTREEALAAIQLSDRYNAKEEYPRIFCSDEFYILADQEIPDSDFYQGYDQLENGIGMIRLSLENWEDIKDDFCNEISEIEKTLIFVTSKSPSKFIESIVKEVNNFFNFEKCKVQIIENNYLGETVTVAGLISANDIFEQIPTLKDQIMVLPSSIFNDDEVTIDQVTKFEIIEHYEEDVIIMNQLFDGWEIESLTEKD